MPAAPRRARAAVSGRSPVSQRIAVQVKTGCCGPSRVIAGSGGAGASARAAAALSNQHKAQISRITDRLQILSTTFLINVGGLLVLEMPGYVASVVKKCNTR